MATPEIPNLKTLLASRRGGPPRSRGRGRTVPGSSHESSDALRDNAVRSTDQDAAGSRVSCVEMGYLYDPYAKLFATQPSTRRLPLLNRGTYVRTSAIDHLVDRFLSTNPGSPKQILSLGAGTDTRYFRVRDKYPDETIIYHEIDFPANTAAKITNLQRHPHLYKKLTDKVPPSPLGVPPGATEYHSPTYNIHSLDLRSIATTRQDTPSHTITNLDPSIPTLLLSEMCLIYLPAPTVSSILHTFITSYIPSPTPLALVLYEPILPNDAFGRTMISNLSSRNIHLPTLLTYPELRDQRDRLNKYGLAESRAVDTRLIWREWVSEDEKERVAGLEMLDEIEELDLLLKHYCVAWGWRDSREGVFGGAWKDIGE